METVTQTMWSKTKLLLKSGIIFAIILLLQIPNFYVSSLIEEREKRQKEAIAEVSSKWANKQTITGPVLVVPYWETAVDSSKIKREKKLACFLPDNLSVTANVTPQEKYRGIYKVMLYTSQVKLGGVFQSIQPQRLGIAPENMLWSEAYVNMNVSDTKGLNDELKLRINDSLYNLQANNVDDGMKAAVAFDAGKASGPLAFSSSFSLNGSEQLLFTPSANNATFQLHSSWPHPSFTGAILPQLSKVTDSGFVATWKTVGFKQGFPQQWKTSMNDSAGSLSSANVNRSSFGADLFVPVNGYQKTMRSIKYSFLCLALTFAAFFLIEISTRTSVHPFQYGLIGLALILFYTLLLSISEYIDFNVAYIIATAATVFLIGWFVKSLLSSGRMAMLLSAILVLLYGYVFTILQLQDYSLLLGSIGLFATLAVVMHFSKRFQW